MASIYVLSALPLDDEGQQRLYQTLCDAIKPVFPLYSLMVRVLPPEAAARGTQNKTACFICVPPTITPQLKKAAANSICDAVWQVVGGAKKPDVTVMFPYHTDDCCGKHGVMRCDAAAAQSKPQP